MGYMLPKFASMYVKFVCYILCGKMDVENPDVAEQLSGNNTIYHFDMICFQLFYHYPSVLCKGTFCNFCYFLHPTEFYNDPSPFGET